MCADLWHSKTRMQSRKEPGACSPVPHQTYSCHRKPAGYNFGLIPAKNSTSVPACPWAGQHQLLFADGSSGAGSAPLALALRDHPGDTEAALVAYEQALFPRSAAVAKQTAHNHQRFFSEDAPWSVAALFSNH